MTVDSSLVTGPAPDLLYGDLERDLRSAVRDVLDDLAPWTAVLARTETSHTADEDLWRVLAHEVGLAGLAIPESEGGAGGSWKEAATVLEELGRSVAPVPFLGSGVMATSLVLRLGDRTLARELADGATACLLVGLGTADWVQGSVLTQGDRCTGTVRAVADVGFASLLLVPTVDGRIVRVDADSPGVSIRPRVSLDMTRQLCDVVLDRAAFDVLADGPEVQASLQYAYDVTAALMASEQLGVAEWCLAQTVDYLQQRRQFGRLLGSYQALRHRCAELWVQITEARAVARYAAACAAEDGSDLPVAAALAQSLCGPVAVRAAEECVQLHGGVGFTWEFPVHMYLKRAKSLELALGSSDVHRARLGDLVRLSPAPFPSGDRPKGSK